MKALPHMIFKPSYYESPSPHDPNARNLPIAALKSYFEEVFCNGSKYPSIPRNHKTMCVQSVHCDNCPSLVTAHAVPMKESHNTHLSAPSIKYDIYSSSTSGDFYSFFVYKWAIQSLYSVNGTLQKETTIIHTDND